LSDGGKTTEGPESIVASDQATTPGASDAPTPRRSPGARSGRLGELAEAYALAAFTVALLIFFSILSASSATFATADNFRIVAAEQSILLIISLAVLVPIVCNAWDFTPGAVAGLAAVFAASTVASSGSIVLAILVALGVGLAIGAINGVLITKFRINSVIATLAMTIVISGIVQWKTNGNTIVNGIPKSLTNFGAGSWLGVPRIAWVAIVAAVLLSLVLTRTVYGRRLYAVGSSSSAARLVGLRNERLIFGTYLISGALSAVAGVLLLARTGSGNPQAGPGFILPAYAAVFLGASAVFPGRWNVWGVVIAVIFLGVLNSGLTLAGANPYVNSLVNGLALIAGVGVANLLARRRGRSIELS
jgi:ribose transport system permease protein